MGCTERTEAGLLVVWEIDVIADGITVVDSRDVYFLVPPSGTGPGEIECP